MVLFFSRANHLCNFGGGYHAEQFCEIILNFDEWFRCRLKDFLSRALAALMTIYAILVDGIMGNIPVKSFRNYSGSGNKKITDDGRNRSQ